MEAKLALLGNCERQTDQPTDQRTWGFIGKLNLQKVTDIMAKSYVSYLSKKYHFRLTVPLNVTEKGPMGYEGSRIHRIIFMIIFGMDLQVFSYLQHHMEGISIARISSSLPPSLSLSLPPCLQPILPLSLFLPPSPPLSLKKRIQGTIHQSTSCHFLFFPPI